jgi:Ca2+-transporting ATPase
MKELNLPVLEEQIRTGEMLKNMSQDELREVVETTQLFARTTPDQKYALVRALQANGEVVAMMGDGVNDAPALHAADIGICVEQASDVAKESSELVLLNSDFNIITAAIEEGRIIFDNIRKIIFYLLSDAFVEILVVLGALVFQLPLPLTAIQIIWINLISDGLPGLALSIDPGRAKVMHEPPRPLGEPLVPNWMLKLIACVSLLAGGVVLGAFFLSLRQTGSLVIAQSFAFLILGIYSLVYVFSARCLQRHFTLRSFKKNPWLILATLIGLLLQTVPFVSPQTRHFFGLTELSWQYWLVAIFLALSLFMGMELSKLIVVKESANGRSKR